MNYSKACNRQCKPGINPHLAHYIPHMLNSTSNMCSFYRQSCNFQHSLCKSSHNCKPSKVSNILNRLLSLDHSHIWRIIKDKLRQKFLHASSNRDRIQCSCWSCSYRGYKNYSKACNRQCKPGINPHWPITFRTCWIALVTCVRSTVEVIIFNTAYARALIIASQARFLTFLTDFYPLIILIFEELLRTNWDKNFFMQVVIGIAFSAVVGLAVIEDTRII